MSLWWRCVSTMWDLHRGAEGACPELSGFFRKFAVVCMIYVCMGNKYGMSYEHDIAVVPVAGDLCARSAPALKRTLDALLLDGRKRIVLNMADVPHVDAMGMTVLITTLKRMRSNGGLLSLVNVSPNVMHALKIARLVELIPVSAAGEHHEVPDLDPSALPLWCTTLPVNANDLHAARVRIQELARRLSFSEDEVFDLTLAAGEALGNATDHTCGTGVLATVSAYPDRMVVEVTDCGDGFAVHDGDASSLPCSEERGRGIRLMQLLVDSVRIETRQSGTGTVVRLVKLV